MSYGSCAGSNLGLVWQVSPFPAFTPPPPSLTFPSLISPSFFSLYSTSLPPFPPFPLASPSLHSPLTLKVCPVYSSWTQPQLKSIFVHFRLKIWHLVSIILMIFPPKFHLIGMGRHIRFQIGLASMAKEAGTAADWSCRVVPGTSTCDLSGFSRRLLYSSQCLTAGSCTLRETTVGLGWVDCVQSDKQLSVVSKLMVLDIVRVNQWVDVWDRHRQWRGQVLALNTVNTA